MKNVSAKKFRVVALLAMVLALAAMPAFIQAAAAPAIVGNWEGSISAGGQSLRIQFHFTQTKEGALAGTLVSPDQTPDAIAIDKIEFKDPALHFEIASIGGSYDGTYDKAKDEISGQWKQGGQSLALTVKRAK